MSKIVRKVESRMLEKQLISRINEDFDSFGRPSFASYISSDCSEAREIESYFKGKVWQEVTLDSLIDSYGSEGSECLGFLVSEAASYYLPSFMVISMKHMYDNNVGIVTYSALQYIERDVDFLLDAYTDNELMCLVLFIEYIKLIELLDMGAVNNDCGPYYAMAIKLLKKLPSPKIYEFP